MIIQDSYLGFLNMDHRTDRLARMQINLAKLGLVADRVRGMPPSEYRGNPKKVEKMRQRTPGAIGCYLGQMEIMRRALDKERHAFVMEDDLVFCEDLFARMQIISDFVANREWDVIWLSGTFHVNPPWWHKGDLGRDAELTSHPRMLRTYGAFSTHAYIVRYRSLPAILAELDHQMERSIGIDYSFIQMQPQLQTFVFVPGCITQYDNRSDIGKGMTIFSGFAKLGPYWYQDRMEQFDPTAFDWKEARV